MRNGSAAIALVMVLGLAIAAAAQEYRVGDLAVRDVWARATPGLAATGAVYLAVSNHGRDTDRLVAVATPVADRAELHVHRMENGVMKMRPADAVDIAPGGSAVLAPGGLHIMLFGLKRPLKEGDRFPLILRFERAGPVTVEVRLRPVGAIRPPSAEGHDGAAHEPQG